MEVTVGCRLRKKRPRIAADGSGWKPTDLGHQRCEGSRHGRQRCATSRSRQEASDERLRGRIQGGGTRRGWRRNKRVRRSGGKVGRPGVPDARDERQRRHRRSERTGRKGRMLFIRKWALSVWRKGFFCLCASRYPYQPSLTLHPFMGLNKFDAGRLHKTRSGKSYLLAHPAWDDDRPTTCPRYNEAPKTLEHAVLSSPAREPARSCHLQGVSDLGPDAPAWSSTSLLAALEWFMRSILTAFAPRMFSCATSAASSVSSCSSNVVFFGHFRSSQES